MSPDESTFNVARQDGQKGQAMMTYRNGNWKAGGGVRRRIPYQVVDKRPESSKQTITSAHTHNPDGKNEVLMSGYPATGSVYILLYSLQSSMILYNLYWSTVSVP
jgi:hypothetical protein